MTSTSILLNSNDRILILAPHPDDEALGCGGIIQKAVAMRIPLRIVYFTYGDNNQWSFLIYRKHPVLEPAAVRSMGLVRHDEAYRATKELGVSMDDLVFLGYPDFRTLAIWYSHWNDAPPAMSMLTRVNSVPYASALRPGAPYKGEEILRDLKSVLQQFKPTKIFLSHAGDHNPDHRALYLFTRIALWDLEKEMNPQLYPYPVHYKYWPFPVGLHPGKPLEPPALFKDAISWQDYSLNPENIKRKQNALEMYKSQYEYSTKYLLSFIRTNELFGHFPAINLEQNTASVPLSPDRDTSVIPNPAQLTNGERALFVGFEKNYVNLENNCLVISIELSRPLGKTVGASVYIFGYSNVCPFAKMPKLHIRFGAIEHRIYDQNRRLPNKIIKIKRQAKHLVLHVPLEVLENPEKILMSSRTYLSKVPLDWTPWREIELNSKGGDDYGTI